jgi:hypothetical protein
VRPIYLVRYGLPAAIALAGVVVLIIGAGQGISAAAGITLIGVAFLVGLVNLLARLAISSQDDREREERARDRFSREGRWR